ncbi:hypothetical protein THAOC_02272, partial [Thalassiosira oceanica]
SRSTRAPPPPARTTRASVIGRVPRERNRQVILAVVLVRADQTLVASVGVYPVVPDDRDRAVGRAPPCTAGRRACLLVRTLSGTTPPFAGGGRTRSHLALALMPGSFSAWRCGASGSHRSGGGEEDESVKLPEVGMGWSRNVRMAHLGAEYLRALGGDIISAAVIVFAEEELAAEAAFSTSSSSPPALALGLPRRGRLLSARLFFVVGPCWRVFVVVVVVIVVVIVVVDDCRCRCHRLVIELALLRAADDGLSKVEELGLRPPPNTSTDEEIHLTLPIRVWYADHLRGAGEQRGEAEVHIGGAATPARDERYLQAPRSPKSAISPTVKHDLWHVALKYNSSLKPFDSEKSLSQTSGNVKVSHNITSAGVRGPDKGSMVKHRHGGLGLVTQEEHGPPEMRWDNHTN